MKILLALILTLSLKPAFSQDLVEGTPFTYMKFGSILGRDYIEVRNPDYIDTNKKHFLVGVEGVEDKEILKRAKELYGENYKCMLSQYFTEAMHAIGIKVTDKVNMKLYLFNWGHKTFDLSDVPSTEENIDLIIFEGINYCD